MRLLFTALACLISVSAFGQSPCNNQTSITYQGYEYEIVEIGDQCWFAENCKYLPEISEAGTISSTTPLAYVYDYSGSSVEEAMNTENYDLYGVLYNYAAVNDWELCPEGWVVGSDSDWSQLTNLWGLELAGQVLKSSKNDSPPWDGTNDVNFNAIAAGYQDQSSFSGMGLDGLWWTSTLDAGGAWRRGMITGSNAVSPIYGDLKDGFSARCVTNQLIIVQVPGCTYEAACNYNPEANQNDMSCLFPGDECDDNDAFTDNDSYNDECECEGEALQGGCTYEAACNYDPEAEFDNNTCLFVGDPCDDGDPNTLDDEIQEDCECAGTPHSAVDEFEALSVLIYPNPASNNLTVDLGDLNGVNTTIKLYDSSSKLVFEKESTSTLMIDVSGFAKGMYSLELATDEQVLRSQVIVE